MLKGTVKKLCALDTLELPQEFLDISVDPVQVEEEISHLSKRYAVAEAGKVATAGDLVYCRADKDSYPDGRSILLYTVVEMPGAEEAAKTVLGKAAGDVFSTRLGEKNVTLTVEKIVHFTLAEVNDALIASIGLEGVATVEGYRAYVTEKKRKDALMEKHKMAIGYVMNAMIDGSEFSYDEKELDAELEANREAIVADYVAFDMPAPSEEEMRQGLLMQGQQLWISKAVCREKGVKIDPEAARAEAEQMMEMMTLMGEEIPDREKMLEEAEEQAYVNAFFDIIDQFVSEKMGE